jgi:thiamine pyrophosphate-dependent acetolactate synthase large subunit-like protein
VYVGVPSDIAGQESREPDLTRPPAPGIGPAALSAVKAMQDAVSTAKKPLLVLGLMAAQSHLKPLIRIKQEHKHYNAGYGTRLFEEGLGIPVIPVLDPDEYQTALVTAFSLSEPVIVHAIISGTEYDDLVLKGNR